MATNPKRITLASNFAADGGGLKNVSLLTTGIEADGHGIFLDEKTASTCMSKLLGRSVKSYLQHTGASSDRLGQEIGFFSGIYRQGQQIKASAFEFLDSFKKEATTTCEKIVEMAQKIPDQFGVSLVLSYLPVWVMPDGSEVQCEGLNCPDGAIRKIPSMRVLEVLSADFVGRPAANPDGLLSVPAVDAAAPMQTQPAPVMTEPAPVVAAVVAPAVVTLSQEQHDAKIAELSTAHTAALDVVKAEVAALTVKLDEANKAHSAALAAKDEAHNKTVSELAEKHKAEIAKKDEAIATAENQSAAKLGIPPLVLNRAAELSADLPQAALKDHEKWAQYAELKAKDEAKADLFYKLHLARK